MLLGTRIFNTAMHATKQKQEQQQKRGKLNKNTKKEKQRKVPTQDDIQLVCVFCFVEFCVTADFLFSCRKDEEKQLDELLFVTTLAIPWRIHGTGIFTHMKAINLHH